MSGPERKNCLPLKLRGVVTAEMDMRPQGRRKCREIMNHRRPWPRKIVETTHPSTLISSLSLHLFHTLRAPSGKPEAQRQEMTGTGAHCWLAAAHFLRRGSPRLRCAAGVFVSALRRGSVIILDAGDTEGGLERQTNSDLLSAELRHQSEPQFPIGAVGKVDDSRETCHHPSTERSRYAMVRTR